MRCGEKVQENQVLLSRTSYSIARQLCPRVLPLLSQTTGIGKDTSLGTSVSKLPLERSTTKLYFCEETMLMNKDLVD